MNKLELISLVSEKTGMSKKDSEKAVKAILDSISEKIAEGEKIQLVGFGTFEVRSRKEHEGRNPLTGEKIKIQALKVPAFKPGKHLKQAVSGPDPGGGRSDTGHGGPGVQEE